jgi:hypothetical protein
VVSEKEAFLIGKDIVKNTLGASFRVRKTKTKIKKKSSKDGWLTLNSDEFYKKKEKGKDIFIQKKGKRLSSKGERKEIKRARKNSGWTGL